ncbi:hypothetical protein [Fischerella thermalis]|uniref:hypothetical protein n=1 Tax=Fischerella thermalis TaxID=372787 RepID=UPI00241FB18B|nr:hypothetical protein [Fischerella thermalis]
MYCPLFLIAIVAETRLIVSHTCGRKIWLSLQSAIALSYSLCFLYVLCGSNFL